MLDSPGEVNIYFECGLVVYKALVALSASLVEYLGYVDAPLPFSMGNATGVASFTSTECTNSSMA